MSDRQTRLDVIYNYALPKMAEMGLEDTLENRLAFLTTLYEAWKNDPEEPWEKEFDVAMDKIFYKLTLNSEIMILKMRLAFSTLN